MNFLVVLSQAVTLLLPLLGSGLVLIATIRLGILNSLNRPIDFGAQLAGKPLIGNSKTFRGLVVHTVVATLITVVLHFSAQQSDLVAPLYRENPWILGPGIAIAYLAGEVINSFVKRRLDIAPSESTKENLGRIVQRFFDNTDGVLVVGILMIFVYQVAAELLALSFILSLLVHEITDAIMRKLGLKKHQ